MTLVETRIVNGKVCHCSCQRYSLTIMCVTGRGLYVLVLVNVGCRLRCRCTLAHGATIYSRMTSVRVFVSPYPLGTRPPVPVRCLALRLRHNTLSPSNTWPDGQSWLVSLGTVFMMYSPYAHGLLVCFRRGVDARSDRGAAQSFAQHWHRRSFVPQLYYPPQSGRCRRRTFS